MPRKPSTIIFFYLCLTSALGAQEMDQFMQKLKQASELAHQKAEQAAQMISQRTQKVSKETEEKLAADIAEITKKIEVQSGVTAGKIRITVENLNRAFAGAPLLPVVTDNYLRAVAQVQSNGYTDQQKPLIPITPWNKELIWLNPQKTHLLMTSWMSFAIADRFYRPYLGKTFMTLQSPGTYMWVTVVPEIQQIAQKITADGIKGTALQQRLEQYLGLPHGKDERVFVQVWVRPSDLFRPCLDPDIMSSFCTPDADPKKLPASFQVVYKQMEHYRSSATGMAHARWFTQLKNSQYTGIVPYPWTRLGRSFDWANPTLPFGATEFVIKQGAPVIVESITPTNEYPLLALPKNKG